MPGLTYAIIPFTTDEEKRKLIEEFELEVDSCIPDSAFVAMEDDVTIDVYHWYSVQEPSSDYFGMPVLLPIEAPGKMYIMHPDLYYSKYATKAKTETTEEDGYTLTADGFKTNPENWDGGLSLV